MKDKRKYLFVGARFYVLERMNKMKLKLANVLVSSGSFAEKECLRNSLEYKSFNNKKELLELIKNSQFDVLVSEGCPYILPVSELKKDNQLFINIHPGLLPEIRGASPVNASILFDIPQGVTCHIMDDGVDTGNVISRVLITRKPNIPLDILYRLSFMAEADAFEKAYKNNFKTIRQSIKKSIYYTRHDEDRIISKRDSLETIFSKVKAFALPNQYALIKRNENTYEILDIQEIKSPYLDSFKIKNHSIVLITGNTVLTKENDKFISWKLNSVDNLKEKECLLIK